MKCNVGNTDRIVRIIIGVLILAAGFYFKSWFGLIGILPILTGAFRCCPMYIPLKISTDKKERK